jgi:hypothetical protein
MNLKQRSPLLATKKRIIKFINPLSALTKEGLPEIEAILYSETHGAIF